MSSTGTHLFDHIASNLSDIDLAMIRAVPPGGNWADIPISIPSKRLDQIRAMTKQRGGMVRTTYYGRLRLDKPSYTISTYFNRPGNGCNIHPTEDRTLSIREAARLQSFPDDVMFKGSQSARRNQVGNAVPVLLARAVASMFPPGQVIDLFAGAGGLSFGFALAGHTISVAVDNDPVALEVHASKCPTATHMVGDLTSASVLDKVESAAKDIDIIVGGPPCQGWSFAGWHNHNDPRNILVWQFIEIVRRINPTYFVMENVQGLVWMAGGSALTNIKDEFRKQGYTVTHFVLNAAHYGVPQRRNRVFVIGTKTIIPLSPPNPLFSNDDLFLPSPITVEEAIADLPALQPGEGIDSLPWDTPNDGVVYREWCRSQISFEEMYIHLKESARMRAAI